ncbi:hypothetical protein E2C01_017787 [Portunus trituberculatus]|uniref:Uncharacterized protein n=1 Tax=Portunus trituberculatus TaxID=210409 RepID=A0A5B7DUH8_PORTR|nr:hypothetical protein [Portunus trituberculatus]
MVQPPHRRYGMPMTLQDVVQLLLEIRAEVRDLRMRVTALERQWDAAIPPPQPVPAPVQPAPQPARKNQPQSVPASSWPQPVSAMITSPIVRQPAHGPSLCLPRYILCPSLPQIASPRVCRLVLGNGKSSHQPQSSHRSRRPRPRPYRTPQRLDLVLDSNDMDTDEEWKPRTARTLD